ncbi:hypothetical protein QP260_22845, partial [Escherichia coli]|nr:hypothetical protein [Escherichia coli]
MMSSISAAASGRRLPVSMASAQANSSLRCLMAAPMSSTNLLRSAVLQDAQEPSPVRRKAASAAAMARSVSVASASATSAMKEPSAGHSMVRV